MFSADLAVDILIHTVILFGFLTVFFFLFMSRVTKKTINHALSNFVSDQTQKVLEKVAYWDKKFTGGSINWNAVANVAAKNEEKYEGKTAQIVDHNNNLLKAAIIANIVLVILTVLVILFLRYVLKRQFSLGQIIVQNIVVFALVAGLEIVFFLNIAKNYIPAQPDLVATTVIGRLKELLWEIPSSN